MSKTKLNIKKRLKNFRRKITYSETFLDFISSLSVFVIKIHLTTLKINFYVHPEMKNIDRSKSIYSFWHGRLFLLMPYFKDWGVCILIDLSWSGEIIARICSKLGYKVVRGSSKRKGVKGLINLKKAFNQGWSGGIAVDGPRGPRHKSKGGSIFLSNKSHYPIIPLTYSADRKWVLNTWCHFMIPKPFSKCFISMGPPIWEAIHNNSFTSQELDKVLMRVTDYCDDKF
ncbi:MAG: lysophospholipid acyltransferase family protein [bacterium]